MVRTYLLALAVAILWGFNFVFAKAAVIHFTPFTMLAIRFSLVVLMMLPFYRTPPLPLPVIFKITVLFAVLHIGCMFWSLHLGLDASIGVIVEQLGIPFVMIMGVIFFKERVSWVAVIGVVVSLLGTAVLMDAPNSVENPLAFALMIGSAFFWSWYSVAMKKAEGVNPIALVTWISLLSIPMMALLSFLFESNQWQMVQTADSRVWFSIVYMAIFASIMAHGLWYYLLTNNPIERVAPVILLVPLFGVLGGLVILDEVFTMATLWGMVLMTAGVGMIVLRRPKTVETDIDI